MKKLNETINEKKSGFFTIFFDLFRSLKLTISLLILLAILSIIGTLIAQNASPFGIYSAIRDRAL